MIDSSIKKFTFFDPSQSMWDFNIISSHVRIVHDYTKRSSFSLKFNVGLE